MNEIKEIYNKFSNYIENIKEWKWILISYLVCLLIYISISVQILYQPYIFAEDGKIFFQEALNNGISSIFNTYGGYISVIPRIIALIAVSLGKCFNSFYIVTAVMKFLSILLAIFCINYFNSNEFKWIIKSRSIRLFFSLISILILTFQSNMSYNVTYTHWWAGVFTLLVGLKILDGKMPSIPIILVLVLAILTSPSALLIGIPLMYYIILNIASIIKKKKNDKTYKINRYDIIKIAIIGVAILLQAYAIFFKSKDIDSITSPDISINHIFILMGNIIKCFFADFTNFLTLGISENLPREIDILIGITIWGFIFYINIKNKNIKLFAFLTVEMFALIFMSMYKSESLYELPYFWMNWYNSIPMFCVGLILFKTLYDEYFICKKIYLRIIIISVCMIYFICFYINTNKPDYSFCQEVYKIEPYVDFKSTEMKKIPISGGFYPSIPVNMDKYENKK